MKPEVLPFLNIKRQTPEKREISKRIKDYQEVDNNLNYTLINEQSKRCMNCGVPFCNNGCPLGNIIPEFNKAVQENDWKEAYRILSLTNTFPEFTGRICPAPCETSCVLGIIEKPVSIEHIEKHIIEKAFENNWVIPRKKAKDTGKKIAVIGSGPAGMSVASQLNLSGHNIVVYEKNDKIGGLLRYGIPDFKLDKNIIDRRIKILESESIKFITNANVGIDINYSTDKILSEYDAIVLCGGSTIPRDLNIKGRELKGIHFAMDFLPQQNKRINMNKINGEEINAKDKNVIVIGGGDTGADCVGTSNRQGAKSVIQLEVMPKPPENSNPNTPWPNWPLILRTSTSHEEGCERFFSIQSKEFIGDNYGNLKGLKIVEIETIKDEKGNIILSEKANTEKILNADLILLAMGFLHPNQNGLIKDTNLKLDNRGNVETNNYQTSNEKIFSAGDMRRGQSLVVWALSEGREAAIEVDKYLNGYSKLPSKNKSYFKV